MLKKTRIKRIGGYNFLIKEDNFQINDLVFLDAIFEDHEQRNYVVDYEHLYEIIEYYGQTSLIKNKKTGEVSSQFTADLVPAKPEEIVKWKNTQK